MENDNQTNTATQQAENQNVATNNAGAIDYDKIQSIIDGRTAKTEQSILKDYFTKQGLSEDEMKSAINTYKESKQAKAQQQTQDLTNIQNENTTLKAQLNQYKINDTARDIASDLGVETKTIPYLLKMADLSKAFNEKGEIDKESIKTSLAGVLDELPMLKASNTENKGFVKVGGGNSDDKVQGNSLSDFEAIMGIKPTK